MKNLFLLIIVIFIIRPIVGSASVDTLKDTSDVYDCIIYGYEGCVSELTGENCKRYNGGNVVNLSVGNASVGLESRILFSFPGWDGTMPDSAIFEIYCYLESDNYDRKIFLYPITKQIYEGTENGYNIGGYPNPDSGATWNHAWLDVGDSDSLNWSSSGGDYILTVACTTTITNSSQYFRFNNFERILNYWDSSDNNYGIILINENAFPANASEKTIRSSEGPSSTIPLMLMYFTDSVTVSRRRPIINFSKNK